MTQKKGTDDSGYSPPISIELHLHGEKFNVASVGPNSAILRNARPMDPGTGTIHFDIDGNVVLYHVKLFNGIDPQVEEQPFELVDVQSEVAA